MKHGKSVSKANGHDKTAKSKKKRKGGPGRKPGWGQNLPKEPTSDKSLLEFKPGSPSFLKVQLAKKTAFLVAFAKIGTVTGAARQVGIDRVTHCNWMKDDPEYVKRFEDAEYEAADYVEQEIRRRALIGVEKPVYHEGKRIDVIREYSDSLAMFLMKKLRPAFRENAHLHHIHSGDPNSPIKHDHEHKAQLSYVEFATSFEAAILGKEPDVLLIEAETQEAKPQ